MTIRFLGHEKGIALEVRGVSFSYAPGSAALRDVSFTVPAGELLGIAGPNGAGKTTLVKLLCGLRRANSGEITFRLGPDQKPVGPLEARSKLAVVHQFPAFDMFLTLRLNLLNYLLLRKVRVPQVDERIKELANTLGIADCLDRSPLELSGGQLRKAQILRAVLVRPALLLMDEPTAGLDVTSRKRVWELINEMRKSGGTTVLWTTHEMAEIEKRADQILILNRGEVAWFGPMDMLRRMASVSRVSLEVEDGFEMPANVPGDHILDIERVGTNSVKLLVRSDKVPELVRLVVGHEGIRNVATQVPTLEDLLIVVQREGQLTRLGEEELT